MSKKMLINAMHPEEARVAIVQDGHLVELDIEIEGSEQTRGNVYKGVVVRVEPGLQAAFVDIGLKKLGFLQMGELHPDFWQWRDDVPAENRNRRPRIQEVLRRGQELIVQVEKGERDMKGAALTTYLSFPGRYMVLMPGSDSAGVSRKVESESDRKKLKEMAAELTIPDGVGYIMRTEALGKTKTDLKKDIQSLLKLHKDILAKAKKAKAPALIYQESNLVIRTIRDYFTAEIDEVLVDNAEVYTQAREFFKATMPKFENLVKLHQEKRPIFSRYQLEEQIDQIYEKKVPLKSGGSLVIEPTEALVSIDVNSGKSTGEKGVEDTAFKTNLEAAEEVARQLRLRDLGGLIVIDFIDMRDKKHMSEVEKTLKNALKADKARVTVGRISQFGMLEMSRQRIKQTLEQASYLECPHCGGRGKVKSVENMALSFLRKVHAAAAKGTGAEVRGGLPLEVAYYLLNRKKRELAQVETDYDIEVTIKGKPTFLMNQLELEVIKREKPAVAEGQSEPVAARTPVKAAAGVEIAAGEGAVTEDGKGKKKRRRRKKGRGEGAEAPAGELPPKEITSEEPPVTSEAPTVAEAPDEAASAEEGHGDEAKKKRRRRRRRGKGHGAEAGAEETAAVGESAETLPAAVAEEPVTGDVEEEHGDEQKKKRRRRRRRGGKKTEELAVSGSDLPSSAVGSEPEAPVPSASPAETVEKKPARPRAPRKKKEPAVSPAEVVETPAAEKPVAIPKPRSRAKKAVAAEDAPVAVVEQAGEPAAKPKAKRAPRKKKEEPAGE
ncbi:ribonuclease E/G [Geomobilimonas luticola]|uniref:Ribonuclease G n=1 Tax=Geomobilimonas luticola TaxID=1114878 RepID=A0ABS5SF00_9BACT|nr:Rne/Rng family ribonuclease [Geomobilimonas luticola]MBT0653252.1 Rne/Rng family ribonuclease [Geomobilimonas luticola]